MTVDTYKIGASTVKIADDFIARPEEQRAILQRVGLRRKETRRIDSLDKVESMNRRGEFAEVT